MIYKVKINCYILFLDDSIDKSQIYKIQIKKT